MNIQSTYPEENTKENRWRIMFWLDYDWKVEESTADLIEEIRENWVGLHFDWRIVQKIDKQEEWTIPGSIVKWEWKHYYMMSNVSEDDKYSEKYVNCTWIIMAWTDKISWRNISFMTHQDPVYFLSHKEEFETDLTEKMIEIKRRCE